MNKEKKYYRGLDYLRVLSCIMILLYHLNIVKGGYLLVCTFFVLTGYLTTISIYKNNFSLKKYYINRLKRLYLPLLLVVSVTLIIIKLIPTINLLNIKPESISILLGYNNFWQINANQDYFVRHINSPFIHLWYISILIQFTLLFPLIMIPIKKINKNKQIIIFIILSIISTLYFYITSINTNIMNVYYNTFTRLFSCIFGVTLGLIHINKKHINKNNNIIPYTIANLLLIILCIFTNSKSNNYALYMILTTIISTYIIDIVTIKSNIKEKNNIIDIISNLSYEIYLVQYPIIYLLQSIKNIYIRNIIIIILTILISYIINLLLKKSKNIIINIIKTISIFIIIIIGLIIIINSKDITHDMKALENKLNNNLKINKDKKKQVVKKKEEDIKLEKELEEIKNEENLLEDKIRNMYIVGIGDSVLLSAINELYETFPNGYFDGKVSRSIYGAEDLLIELRDKGELPDILILALATNGDYSDRRNNELMEIVGDRQIYWVNAKGADDPEFNTRFSEYAKNYPNIHIVDWEGVSSPHPEYFYKDGIHPKEEGARVYVDTIFNTIYNELLNELKTKENSIREKKK